MVVAVRSQPDDTIYRNYVAFGQPDGAAIELSSLVMDSGFVVDGTTLSSELEVAGGGDVDADGHADVVFGDPQTGVSWVVLGKDDGDSVELALLQQGSGGFAILPEPGDHQTATAVANAGDVNDDGYDDVLVNDTYASGDGARVYVVLGGVDLANVSLSDVAQGDGGYVIVDAVIGTGAAIAAAGDVNGDGTDDIAMGNYGGFGADFNIEYGYVVFGVPTGP